MFQPPSPTTLIPKLVRAKVPVWLVAAIVVADIVAVQVGKQNEPACVLIYQTPHYSTSVQEKDQRDAIKFNVTSSCTENQAHTDLKVTISSVSGGVQKLMLNSPIVRQAASKKDRRMAHFLEFWVPCTRGQVMNYLSNAQGNVLLQSGKRIPVSKSIEKPVAVRCEPKAK